MKIPVTELHGLAKILWSIGGSTDFDVDEAMQVKINGVAKDLRRLADRIEQDPTCIVGITVSAGWRTEAPEPGVQTTTIAVGVPAGVAAAFCDLEPAGSQGLEAVIDRIDRAIGAIIRPIGDSNQTTH